MAGVRRDVVHARARNRTHTERVEVSADRLAPIRREHQVLEPGDQHVPALLFGSFVAPMLRVDVVAPTFAEVATQARGDLQQIAVVLGRPRSEVGHHLEEAERRVRIGAARGEQHTQVFGQIRVRGRNQHDVRVHRSELTGHLVVGVQRLSVDLVCLRHVESTAQEHRGAFERHLQGRRRRVIDAVEAIVRHAGLDLAAIVDEAAGRSVVSGHEQRVVCVETDGRPVRNRSGRITVLLEDAAKGFGICENRREALRSNGGTTRKKRAAGAPAPRFAGVVGERIAREIPIPLIDLRPLGAPEIRDQ